MRYRLSYETLQPLAVLRSLRELKIEWSEQISLDDDEVADLARSFGSSISIAAVGGILRSRPSTRPSGVC